MNLGNLNLMRAASDFASLVHQLEGDLVRAGKHAPGAQFERARRFEFFRFLKCFAVDKTNEGIIAWIRRGHLEGGHRFVVGRRNFYHEYKIRNGILNVNVAGKISLRFGFRCRTVRRAQEAQRNDTCKID